MAANSNKLTALKVKKVNAVGRYADGNCLYLYVDKLGSKRWVLRLVVRGRRRDMGLGSVNLVSLEEARDLARSYRRIAREGGDPVQERNNSNGSVVTLQEAALQVHKLNGPTWKKILSSMDFVSRAPCVSHDWRYGHI